MRRLTTWEDVVEAARTTRGKVEVGKTPTTQWKTKMLISEHSPIRFLTFTWTWEIPSWVSVHFVRHKIGIEHWVKSQRPEREAGIIPPQDAIVIHKAKADTQAIINISKERLCACASEETRLAWDYVINALRDIGEIELAKCCVPKCCYRGFCPEGRFNCQIGPYSWQPYRQFIKHSDMRIFD